MCRAVSIATVPWFVLTVQGAVGLPVYFSKSSQMSVPAQGSALPAVPAMEIPPPAATGLPPTPAPAGAPALPGAPAAAVVPPALAPAALAPPALVPAVALLPATLLAPADGVPLEGVVLSEHAVSTATTNQPRKQGPAGRAPRGTKRRRIYELYYFFGGVRCYWN